MMKLDEKLRELRAFLAASREEQSRIIQIDYVSQMPKSVDAMVELQWHIGILEEQLDHLSPKLFELGDKSYSLEMFRSSIQFVAVELCIALGGTIVANHSSKLGSNFVSAWTCTNCLSVAIRKSPAGAVPAARAYQLMYASARMMGMLLAVTSIREKGGLTPAQVSAFREFPHPMLQAGQTVTSSVSMLTLNVRYQVLELLVSEHSHRLTSASRSDHERFED